MLKMIKDKRRKQIEEQQNYQKHKARENRGRVEDK